MKKIILSALAALTIGSVVANAGDIKLYQDANGQVFTTAGEGRTEIKQSAPTLSSHASKLKFSGLTYIGATAKDYKDTGTATTAQMELRRGYFQLKAYLLDDAKSYYRVTFDLKQDSDVDGYSTVLRAKYAYLYLNEILPNTGIEIGLTHRPWHDYEEHNAWYFRNISKVLIEDKNYGGNLSNSADFGVMTKTKTQYFDADIGVFNGEGYHGKQNASNGLSLEWRTTVHILGVNGKDKQNKKTYWDTSFYGQYNKKHATVGGVDEDLVFMGLHTVYNEPSFLLSAQYVSSQDTRSGNAVSEKAGSGYSFNGEYRIGNEKEYRALVRYDSWTDSEVNSADEKANTGLIVGAAWDQNRNVQWVANVTVTDNKNDVKDNTAYMLTAQVEF